MIKRVMDGSVRVIGISISDLIDPQRNNRTTTAHNISIAGTANLRLTGHSGLGNCYLLFNCLGNSHGINRISRLICRKADHTLYSFLNGSCQNISVPITLVRTASIGKNSQDGTCFSAAAWKI